MYNSTMRTVADIVRRRRMRRNKNEGGLLPKALHGFVFLFSVLLIFSGALVIVSAILYSELTRDLPTLERLPTLMDPDTGLLSSPTEIYDRTGEHLIATLGTHEFGASYLTLQSNGRGEIPQDFINALVSVSDPGFWEHPGFIAGTLFQQEPDTIPLKLVSDLLFWQESAGLHRALREKLVAAQLISNYGRPQVLEWYVNSAHFGHDLYGLDAAAIFYFGKPAAQLSLSQSVSLAVLVLTPDLNPVDTPEIALAKRNEALKNLLGAGLITESEYQNSRVEPLEAVNKLPESTNEVSAFVEFVRNQVSPHIPREVLARGGYSIYSTLDMPLQSAFYCVLGTQIARIQNPSANLSGECEAARLLPLSTDTAIREEGPRGEGVIIEPRTGQIHAFISRNTDLTPNEKTVGHPPGSILTPYVYLSALTRGYSPASLVWDIAAHLPLGLTSSPNLDGAYHGPMRIRVALGSDFLVPALHFLDQFTPGNVWETAALSGLPSLANEHENILLDGGEIPLLEVVHAFGALSTQGVLFGKPELNAVLDPVPLHPIAVLRVEDRARNEVLNFATAQARPVISAQLAYLLTHMLSDETARWPALGRPNALELGRPSGVKTGFTQDFRNAWTVGFTPQYAVGVWLGVENTNDRLDQLSRINPTAAAGIWNAIQKFAHRDLPVEGWPAPQGIEELEICDPSGLLPTAECQVIVRDLFLPGNAPVQSDNLYRQFEINRETGLLATVFTPVELIDEKIFLVPPPEAKAWALEAGIPLPPENYDLVSQPAEPDENALVTSPEMFSYIRGVVNIEGSAFGEGFQSYSVQVGQGLNPQQWLQIGPTSDQAVNSDTLAIWDTRELQGLFALRLLVLREDNLVDTHIVQLTIDNQAPVAEILYPFENQVFNYPEESNPTLQLSVSDDVSVAAVEIYLDDALLLKLFNGPYAAVLNLTPGQHEIKIIVFDLAGNSQEVGRIIQVENP